MHGHKSSLDFKFFLKDKDHIEITAHLKPRYRAASSDICGVYLVIQDATNYKKAETELSLTMKDPSYVIELADAPVFGIDKDGVIVEWNPKAEEIFGHPKQEALTSNLVDRYIPVDLRESVRSVLHSALCGNETANFEFTLVNNEKRNVEVLLDAKTHRDQHGEIVGVYGVLQDISGRKRTEMRLKVLSQNPQLLPTSNDAIVFGVDRQGYLNEWSSHAETVVGHSREEAIGRNFVQEFVAVEYRSAVYAVLERALIGKHTENFEFPIFKKGEDHTELLVNAEPRRDVSGVIVGCVCVAQDVTAWKRAESELSFVEIDCKKLVDDASLPIIGLDIHGIIVIWNAKVNLFIFTTPSNLLSPPF